MHRLAGAAVAALSTVLVIAGCTSRVEGAAVSVYADPFHVAGLPATDGPSGLRPDAPGPSREAENSDGGAEDELALQSVSDVEEFWKGAYTAPLKGTFRPVDELISWDYFDRDSPRFCGDETYRFENAAYCFLDNTIGWDRGRLLPTFRQAFGDMAITLVLAHEYGHALQDQAKLITDDSPTIVAEQQADCFAGVYMRYVAAGDSKRFTLSTGDGLNSVLAAMVALRDPVVDMATRQMELTNEHGSAFERISAFQFGFTDGAAACAAINEKEIAQRRGDMPLALQGNENGELPVSKASVTQWVEALNKSFSPANPPTLSFDPAPASSCADARPSPPVSYCPATNTIAVDLPALQRLGARKDDMTGFTFGDNTAYSVLTSRYMLALEHQRAGLALDNAQAALRTACLTGVATTKFSGGVDVTGDTLSLSAGDLDEAVSGILTNGLAAGDVNGESVPSGFARIDAFRMGVLGDQDRCFKRYA